MKALRTILTVAVLFCGAMAMNAQSMSITAMRSNARFLTDRMAYTLGISDPYLIDEMYRINYDYILGVNGYLDDVALGYYYDDYMAVCTARDLALRTLLGARLWDSVVRYSYFHRPIVFANRGWHFSIYDYDRYGAHHFFCAVPRPFSGGYAGGHFFRGMAPKGGRPNGVRPNTPNHHVGTPSSRGAGVQPNLRGDRTPNSNNRPNVTQPQPQGKPSGSMNQGRGTSSRSENNVRSSSRNSSSSASAPRSTTSASRSSASRTSSAGATRSTTSSSRATRGGRR